MSILNSCGKKGCDARELILPYGNTDSINRNYSFSHIYRYNHDNKIHDRLSILQNNSAIDSRKAA